MDTVVIPGRCIGPPNSAQGGYGAGVLAREIDGAAQVTLRRPPPVDRELTLDRDGDAIRLLEGDDLIADARPATLDLTLRPAPDPAQARAAAEDGEAFCREFTLNCCFVCGVERADGLRIFAAPRPEDELALTTWTPGSEWDRGDGQVAPEIVWAALDCPGYSALYLDRERPELAVLGRMTAAVPGPVAVGAEHVIAAWPLDADGRKRKVATALYAPDGEAVAWSLGVWIELR